MGTALGDAAPGPGHHVDRPGDLVVCSLEAWDDVWRRNQFLVRELLAGDTSSKVLFVEPAVYMPYELARGRRPQGTGLRKITDDGRLWALRPRKFLPRMVAGGAAELQLARTTTAAVSKLALAQPLLWVNDAVYAELAQKVNWPVVYDITDDWLLANGTRRSLKRLALQDASLLRRAEEVVVVSPSLVASRGSRRDVHLIGNGVDFKAFSKALSRPADMPPPPVALYVGSQHETRLDIELCIATAQAIRPARLVFVGPNYLARETSARLKEEGCLLLGARPYHDIPAYYQSADVVVVPHGVNPFTESLDPIKGYECLAAGRPTVSTPVAGMRALGTPVETVPPAEFPSRVRQAISENRETKPGEAPSWAERAQAFSSVLVSARQKRAAYVAMPDSGERRDRGLLSFY